MINFCDSDIPVYNETVESTDSPDLLADEKSDETTKDPLTRHRVANNETALVSEIRYVFEN